MVGISGSGNDALLAKVDQLDLLGLNNSHRDNSTKWLLKRAKKVRNMLHPDRLVNVPRCNELPYRFIHANAVAKYLESGVAAGNSSYRIRFWKHANIDHRVRWQPFDSQDQLRSLHDPLLYQPRPTSDNAHVDRNSLIPWSGERARKPYGAEGPHDTNTHEDSATAADEWWESELDDEESEMLNDESLSPRDRRIKLKAASLPERKLFAWGRDENEKRFVFARMKLPGQPEKWSLVAAQIDRNYGLRLTLRGRDIDVHCNIFHQPLKRGPVISWEAMTRYGFFGVGREFKNVTKQSLYRFAGIKAGLLK